ncbi:Josephin-domain-containing protein [Anaeromyces robustus]|uniref:ubiquitinyl hydrolase 1 n=1 Tax=Anaeromyces robustus TaxID=1754192 RepID=A0A1Y1XR43_9FUNG|nr:Josephin-domain-containing protein [Anaeromyces robustus]|eukprot:ORX87784.1 Josephin-domain-containing protein [Anaeromyces robustus]
MDLIPYIYHEKQEGALCAQHALNSLLQGEYFTAVDLANIAHELDEEEAALNSNQNSSQNYDDTGFFSIQVISVALSRLNLEISHIGSEAIKSGRLKLAEEKAYICNLDEHWFSLRKFYSKYRWYNLNSTLTSPEWLSETYLEIYLDDILRQGYSVFVVRGDLPVCDADEYAQLHPKPETKNNVSSNKNQQSFNAFSGKGYRLNDSNIINENTYNFDVDNMTDDQLLAQAIAISMEEQSKTKNDLDMDEIKRKRLERFNYY